VRRRDLKQGSYQGTTFSRAASKVRIRARL
jgi:hypothetical protein